MILYASNRAAGAWRARLRERLRAALGPAAAEPWADDAAAAVAVFLARAAGARPVRDDDVDAALGAALCELGRPEFAQRLIGGRDGTSRHWRAALASGAPPALRHAALRRWLRPAGGATRREDVWTLDLGRLFRDEPTGLELARHRRLAAVLDALAESVPAEHGLAAIALRLPRDADRRAAAELRDFCAARLAEAARRRAWPRVPEILRADLRT